MKEYIKPSKDCFYKTIKYASIASGNYSQYYVTGFRPENNIIMAVQAEPRTCYYEGAIKGNIHFDEDAVGTT